MRAPTAIISTTCSRRASRWSRSRVRFDGLDADYVGADSYAGATLALEHLFELATARCACGQRSAHIQRTRPQQAFIDAHERRGYSLDEEMISNGSGALLDGEDAVRSWLAHNDRAGAMLCANATVAFGAMAEARRNGIDVPSQLSIVGTDDVEVAGIMNPGLTTISTNHVEIARQAAAIMIRRIEDPEMERMSFVTRPELIVRGTTARAFL